MKQKKKKVMVFGVFDKFHDGHGYFLTQAKALGDRLVVVVATERMVQALKGKTPTHSLEKRIEAVKNQNIADEVFPSDPKPREWTLLRKIKPDIIAIGHDQNELEKALKEEKTFFAFDFEIVKIDGHKSHIYHTSLLG